MGFEVFFAALLLSEVVFAGALDAVDAGALPAVEAGLAGIMGWYDKRERVMVVDRRRLCASEATEGLI